MVSNRYVEASQTHSANFAIRTWDADAGHERDPRFGEFDPFVRERLAAAGAIPSTYQEFSNTTCVGLSELIVDALDASSPDLTDSDAVIELGTGTVTPGYTDRTLDSYVDEIEVRTYADEGEQIRYRAFLPSSVANQSTITEVGVRVDGKLLNHSLLATDIEKDSSTEATITSVLKFDTV